MKAKKLIMLTMAILLLLAVPAVIFAAKADGKATAKAPTNIVAKFEFNITGLGLEITGTATGLSEGKAYHSAVYGIGSSANGIASCLPADDVGGSMGLGNWSDVDENGEATLSKVSNADLDKIATVSVRSGPAGVGNIPSNIVLVCGKVTP